MNAFNSVSGVFTDILKSLGAHKITTFLKPHILLWINRVAGLILIVSGISLMWKVANMVN